MHDTKSRFLVMKFTTRIIEILRVTRQFSKQSNRNDIYTLETLAVGYVFGSL